MGCSQPGARIAIDRAIHGKDFDRSCHDNRKHLKKIYEMLYRHQTKKLSQILHSSYPCESVAFIVVLLKEGFGPLTSKIWENRYEMQIMIENICAVEFTAEGCCKPCRYCLPLFLSVLNIHTRQPSPLVLMAAF